MSPHKDHIILFSYMPEGHANLFLSLALKLEQQNCCNVTIINTPPNITKLEKNLPESSTIRLLQLPFETTECDSPLPLKADLLKPAFRSLIRRFTRGDDPPACIISDMFFAWSASVAHEFGASHAIFNSGGGYGMAALHTTWLNLPHLKSDSGDDFQLPGFPAFCRFKRKNLSSYLLAVKKPWKFASEMFDYWKETDAMLFNTVEELDHIGLDYFRRKFPDCHVFAVGGSLSVAASGGGGATGTLISDWLDCKEKGSVLYVSFASQSSPSETQTQELAKALEASNVNFLWLINPSSINQNWLPIGFEKRIRSRNKGLLVKSCAPHLHVLSHSSIGGFLGHCGWNSTMEALSNGVPMLSWPMGGEQSFNAQFLDEELGVSVTVANGVIAEVEHEDLVRKIRLVMEDYEGKVMRVKACMVKDVIGKEACCSEDAFDCFLETCLYKPWNCKSFRQLPQLLKPMRRARVEQVPVFTWKKPQAGWYKLNIDGSVLKQSNMAAAGGVIRDNQGTWQLGFALKLGITSIVAAELMGLREGLRLAWERRYQRLEVECDSSIVVDLVLKEEMKDHPLGEVVKDCRWFLNRPWTCSLRHVKRAGNALVSMLGQRMTDEYRVWEHPPEGLEIGDDNDNN